MKTVRITCDTCERDLTTTGNCVDYRLVVMAEAKQQVRDGAAVTLMHIVPPVERPYYFCGMGCLDKWRASAMQEKTNS